MSMMVYKIGFTAYPKDPTNNEGMVGEAKLIVFDREEIEDAMNTKLEPMGLRIDNIAILDSGRYIPEPEIIEFENRGAAYR